MKKYLLVGVFTLILNLPSFAQEIPVIKYDDLVALMKEDNGKIKVINFWATWCAPCVAEMPDFEKFSQDYAAQNVEVIFVSLDFAENLDKVEKFIDRKGYQSRVVLLDEIDYDAWLPKINKSWSGSIPATLIISGTEQNFTEGSLHYQDLEEKVQSFL